MNSPEGQQLPLVSPAARLASVGGTARAPAAAARKPAWEGPRGPSAAVGHTAALVQGPVAGPQLARSAPDPGTHSRGSLGLREGSRPGPQRPSSANFTSLLQPTSVVWLLKNDLIFAISPREGAPN